MSHRHSGCGCSEDQKQLDAEQHSLLGAIDRERVHCLNERTEPQRIGCHVIKPWTDRLKSLNDSDGENSSFLESNEAIKLDASGAIVLPSSESDCELLLHIPFVSAVHLRSIAFIVGGDTKPKTVKLYVNREELDFAGANEREPVQELTLADDLEGYLSYPLKMGRYQNVRCLTLFFQGVSGASGMVARAGSAATTELRSRIDFVHLKGVDTQVRQQVYNVVYESKANPADHERADPTRTVRAFQF